MTYFVAVSVLVSVKVDVASGTGVATGAILVNPTTVVISLPWVVAMYVSVS